MLGETLNEVYPSAVIVASRETGLEERAFPATFGDTGWSWKQVLDPEFYPD